MVKKISKNAETVLQYFFKHPSAEVHIRGLAETLGKPYSSTRNALRELHKNDLLGRREESKMVFYGARSDDAIFRNQKRIYNLDMLYRLNVVEKLETELRPDALVLFGSFCNGSDHEESDIDIAVINGRDRSVSLADAEDALGRTFHLVHIPAAREEEDAFRNTLANGYVLSGHLSVI